jgi:aminoglycoside 3-N-acetyltransferase
MLTFADFKTALDSLELGKKPAIAHASLKSFGDIQGGPETVLEALLASVSGLAMPAFTYKTMIIPEVGPPNNGVTYGRYRDLNRMAEPFYSDMPVDPLIGILAETLRCYPGATRTAHPILSFAGVNVDSVLNAQTINNPFAPIGWLADHGGWVLLLGVDHTVNSSIHYAEKLAGRRQFVRWALTKQRIVECPGFPGCSEGFETIRPEIGHVTRRVEIGSSFIEAIPIHPLLRAVEMRINKDPLALLCQRDDCERCDAVRCTVSEM